MKEIGRGAEVALPTQRGAAQTCSRPRTAFWRKRKGGKAEGEAEARLDFLFVVYRFPDNFHFQLRLVFAEARLPARGNGFYYTFILYVHLVRGESQIMISFR